VDVKYSCGNRIEYDCLRNCSLLKKRGRRWVYTVTYKAGSQQSLSIHMVNPYQSGETIHISGFNSD